MCAHHCDSITTLGPAHCNPPNGWRQYANCRAASTAAPLQAAETITPAPHCHPFPHNLLLLTQRSAPVRKPPRSLEAAIRLFPSSRNNHNSSPLPPTPYYHPLPHNPLLLTQRLAPVRKLPCSQGAASHLRQAQRTCGGGRQQQARCFAAIYPLLAHTA